MSTTTPQPQHSSSALRAGVTTVMFALWVLGSNSIAAAGESFSSLPKLSVGIGMSLAMCGDFPHSGSTEDAFFGGFEVHGDWTVLGGKFPLQVQGRGAALLGDGTMESAEIGLAWWAFASDVGAAVKAGWIGHRVKVNVQADDAPDPVQSVSTAVVGAMLSTPLDGGLEGRMVLELVTDGRSYVGTSSVVFDRWFVRLSLRHAVGGYSWHSDFAANVFAGTVGIRA